MINGASGSISSAFKKHSSAFSGFPRRLKASAELIKASTKFGCNAIAISKGHSNSAYSFEVLYPKGKEMAGKIMKKQDTTAADLERQKMAPVRKQQTKQRTGYSKSSVVSTNVYRR